MQMHVQCTVYVHVDVIHVSRCIRVLILGVEVLNGEKAGTTHCVLFRLALNLPKGRYMYHVQSKWQGQKLTPVLGRQSSQFLSSLK